MTEEEIISCIVMDLRLLQELPNHCQTEQTKEILAGYREKVPDLYAAAEKRHIESLAKKPAAEIAPPFRLELVRRIR